jgi:hypothetical protein
VRRTGVRNAGRRFHIRLTSSRPGLANVYYRPIAQS